MFCVNCGGKMNDNAAFCPHCGYQRKVNQVAEKNTFNNSNTQIFAENIEENNNYSKNTAYADYNQSSSAFCVRCGRKVPQGYKLCPECLESERSSGGGSSKSGVVAIIISSVAVLLLIVCVLVVLVIKPFESDKAVEESHIVTESKETVNDVVEESVPKKISSTYEVYYTYYPVTWEEANQIAKSKGGYLACVDSREEFVTLCELADSNDLVAFWIGAKRESGAGWNTAKYTNGESLDYVKWLPGEPTYFYDGIEETYLMVLRRDDEWFFNDNANDLSMDYPGENYRGRISFIIEKDVY